MCCRVDPDHSDDSPPTGAGSDRATTVTGAVGETIQEFQSTMQQMTKQACLDARAGAKDQRRAERRQLAEQHEQLNRKRKAWEMEHEEAVRTLEDLMARRQKAIEVSEQEAAADRAQAAAYLAQAQQSMDHAAAQLTAADQASRGADLKLLSAKRQLAQMLLWAGSLAYAFWIMHPHKL